MQMIYVYNPTMITFRPATKNDIPELERLVNSAYRGDFSKKGWTTEADILGGQRTDQEKLLEMMNEVSSRFELALNGNEIIGSVFIKNEGSYLYFGMLTVNPLLQTMGIGKLLLKRVEEIAKELGHMEIRMTVISVRKELIAYYERRGYLKTGRTEPFPENDPRFGLPKMKLIFEEFSKKI